MVEHIDIQSKIIEADLTLLAGLLDVNIKTGWKTRLAEKLKLNDVSDLSNWIRRGAVPRKKIAYLESIGIKRESWRSQDIISSSSNGQKKLAVNCPPDADPNMIGMAGIVLNSGTIYGTALKHNIEAFYRAVQ